MDCGGTDVMERPCAVARGKDINNFDCACALDLCRVPSPRILARRTVKHFCRSTPTPLRSPAILAIVYSIVAAPCTRAGAAPSLSLMSIPIPRPCYVHGHDATPVVVHGTKIGPYFRRSQHLFARGAFICQAHFPYTCVYSTLVVRAAAQRFATPTNVR
jgi:hypothetical protein